DTNNAKATNTDVASIGPGPFPVPRSAQRNPSTTPAIGFNPYSTRHDSGTRLLGYAIGVANSHICVRNGRTYWTSRYCTFSAENHIPTPNAVAPARSTNSGSVHTATVGTMW